MSAMLRLAHSDDTSVSDGLCEHIQVANAESLDGRKWMCVGSNPFYDGLRNALSECTCRNAKAEYWDQQTRKTESMHDGLT